MEMDPEFRKAGGPAFPFIVETGDGATAYHPGMTLRDYFAAQVAGNVIGARTYTRAGCEPDEIAREAYRLADAMLAARSPVSMETSK